jgi:hypothetical protein
MYKKLLIEYADPADLDDSITLEFRLRNNPIVARWVERVETAQAQYPIDDPARFYGLGGNQVETALLQINKCISLINSHQPIIDRTIDTVTDQDTLNYLHNIFERYHGLLDQQNNDFWLRAPASVRRALADLNILVHRCESVARGADPRHVVTWFGLPKDQVLRDSDYAHAVHIWRPGTVFLNYVEIGKTIQDLAEDDDQYIAAEAFQPFRHYSADFVVRFFARTPEQADAKYMQMYNYYLKNQEFFGAWQYCYTNASLPLADLTTPLDLDQLATRQFVKSVRFK